MRIRKETRVYKFPVIIEKDEDGLYVADCPDLQGCHTQGKTIEDAITNIRDAIKLNLKILKEEKQDIPNTEPVSITSLEVMPLPAIRIKYLVCQANPHPVCTLGV